MDVLWRIGMGVLLGYGTGKVLARLFFSARHDSIRLSNHSEGFVALAATFLAYGVTQMIEGYGFIAVFVCAVTIRAAATMVAKSSGSRLAPPTSAPSTSGCARISGALSGFTLPP